MPEQAPALVRHLLTLLSFYVLLFSLFALTGCGTGQEAAPADFNYHCGSDTEAGGDTLIPEGFYINRIPVGGKTKDEAKAALKELDESPVEQTVILTADGKEVSATLTELGIAGDVEEAVDRCLELASGGGVVRRYLTGRDLQYGTLRMEYDRNLDRAKVEEFIKKAAETFDQKPVNAKLKMRDGSFEITPEQNGRAVSVSTTLAAILDAFNNMTPAQEELRIEAVMETAVPEKTAAAFSQVKDVLGSFSTVYRREGKKRNDRCINVEVAAAYIDGTVLMPGASASTSDLMRDRSQENGYAVGHMYVDGVVEDAVGGGVCQVATTLYQALLRAELQIDARKNHSMTVTYVDPSMDAAIANGSKDLKFTNNTDAPIYIFSETDGSKVYFKIYGKETRDPGRKLEFISVEDDRVESEDIIVEDSTMYRGEEEKSGESHDEVRSHLVKVVYQDGVEVSRDTLHSDYYSPSYRTVKRGTKPPETDAEETTGAAEEPAETEAAGTEAPARPADETGSGE